MPVGPLTLRKLHGAGNDFLVVVDPDDRWPVDEELARALCDRRGGIGADGVLRALPPSNGADLRMELRNADGSAAATSGNGLRCVVLAALDAGMVSSHDLRVETASGTRRVEVRSISQDGGDIAVEMGVVRLGPDELDVPAPHLRSRRAEVGNLHLVVLARELAKVDIGSFGRAIDEAEPGGINVEAIEPLPGDVIEMVVWERGAGLTRACGSGSCAAAAAARAWGLCGDSVTVRNPGGDMLVDLSGEATTPHAVLFGPTLRVATMTVLLDADVHGEAAAGVGDPGGRPA